ncbi:diaminopimelate decarboxylase [Bartonella bacilliformis Peru38]|uniref:Diaminopimelate decarboxylase n=2 Tax=Bartonella bacilliformis TaxID=774 RepID=A1UQZ1_BARBK|nr:diaminopimelate decarboxylase [Bartonella bacilliformis]ABM45236.1 diaminopimelate decarboxylase [Bartonella bacilliformis KC583]AMG85290.1 diaminopimelate decarboxylase [Bartonella bacilliformis]EKS45952.1 diaminopimelate decarboxylase [Bartonella bacilliformis INS]EYS88809.1 diaminopimelate decarboxylase [Bartonella bacilliformis San Pedro600-02]EYS95512.1 diaminopimelate decarboxylase [Bartonella bacilliformis Peru-18]
MNFFSYHQGELHAEGLSLSTLAKDVGTPFYCYSSGALVAHFKEYQEAFHDMPSLIAYAVKANSNQAVLRILAAKGAGADVVSEGELRRALAVGITPQRIVYSGVGKTVREIDFALSQDIFCFNVESEPELEQLSARAVALSKTARISLRINPDVDAKTHKKITTGRFDNKFGIPLSLACSAYKKAAQLPGLQVRGMDMHIGSQICDLKPFEDAFLIAADFVRHLWREGYAITHIDIGGGLGISYHPEQNMVPSPADYAALVRKHIAPLGINIILEPGRSIAGHAGVLVTSVIYLKRGEGRNFVVVDGAMNDFLRPTLYDAWQTVVPVKKAPEDAPLIMADIVGPVCETGDYLGLNRSLPMVAAGDLLAITGAGAYGAVMASTYNSRLLVPEILVQNTRYDVIRPRLDYEQLMGLDHIPDWIENF